MKKTIIIFTISIIAISFMCMSRHIVLNYTIGISSISMDEDEHMVGKDSVFIWQNGVFQIGHYSSGNHLEFHENNVIKTILKNVNSYETKDGKFYVVTQEGYAIIDKENIAKVFVLVPENEYINGYSINENGEKEPYSRRIDNVKIKYIMSFDEFTEMEQAILNKMAEG